MSRRQEPPRTHVGMLLLWLLIVSMVWVLGPCGPDADRYHRMEEESP